MISPPSAFTHPCECVCGTELCLTALHKTETHASLACLIVLCWCHVLPMHVGLVALLTCASLQSWCSLRQWVFDSEDGSARLLKLRSGHGAAPSCVRHYNEGGTRLLSAGIESRVGRLHGLDGGC